MNPPRPTLNAPIAAAAAATRPSHNPPPEPKRTETTNCRQGCGPAPDVPVLLEMTAYTADADDAADGANAAAAAAAGACSPSTARA